MVVVTAILGHFGAAALAGYGLGSRLELMLTPLVFGVGSALTAGVGANVVLIIFSEPAASLGQEPALRSSNGRNWYHGGRNASTLVGLVHGR